MTSRRSRRGRLSGSENIMKCCRGDANPDAGTKIRLFADSAGYCQNPNCLQHLFVETSNGKTIHFGEMAHIIAASKNGPRSSLELTNKERGSYENLILLCANCHTMIDKAPREFTDDTIRQWKHTRAERLANLFGICTYISREEVRNAIEPLLCGNRVIFEQYGPSSEARFDLESETLSVWYRKILGIIIPNNKHIIAILKQNRKLMVGHEPRTLEEFRQHNDDLIARHVANKDGGMKFPEAMDRMMVGDV
ncbi:MAG: HNH endonuclease [Roseomonas sp.]|nr:HNH endonuclease [Roseomonas sp.]